MFNTLVGGGNKFGVDAAIVDANKFGFDAATVGANTFAIEAVIVGAVPVCSTTSATTGAALKYDDAPLVECVTTAATRPCLVDVSAV
jgi:hypothetical protein